VFLPRRNLTLECAMMLIMKRQLRKITFASLLFPGLLWVECATRLNAQQRAAAAAAPSGQATTAEQAEEGAEGTNKAKIEFTWLAFPDSTKFKVLGLHWFEENQPTMWRMPRGQFDALPNGVKRQSRHPTGGRILIKCDTTKLGLRVLPMNKGSLKGFDVYIDGRFFKSAIAEEPKVETELVCFNDLEKKEREIVIYLPYHQEILVKGVGVDEKTKFSVPEHKFTRPLPIVFYGSSVCQGSGALKPGMTYEAILARALNLDFINLGFGGAGKAEENVVRLVNSIPACCYVFDLGKSYGMQDLTAFKRMLQTVRKSHPGVPLICMTPITSAREVFSQSYSNRSVHTRTVMRDATNEFMKTGEKNVYLLEGTDLLGFEEHDGLSRDGVHPTDYGYSLIAGKLLPVLKKALAN
jgi:lysophospholipase L1-like esterase